MPSLDRVDVVVPLRSLAGGKARLGGALDAEEREELLLGMLRRTLLILSGWPPAERVHVVSTDPRVMNVARKLGALALFQEDEGLNAALRLGREAALGAGAGAILILPADLPLLVLPSLDRMLDAADAALAAGSGRPLVVIAPSDARNGTNGLLLFPPDVIAPCFGPTSFEAHVRAARGSRREPPGRDRSGLGFDLDTPEDFERAAGSAVIDELLELGRRRSGEIRGVVSDGGRLLAVALPELPEVQPGDDLGGHDRRGAARLLPREDAR